MQLSIIIPCWNEDRTVEKIITKINNIVKYEKEIIVIDDFSSDKSYEILNRLYKENKIQQLIKNEKNYGKGYSVRKGIEKATGQIILIQDADLEYDPDDYPKLVEPIINNFADVVFGSRFIGSDAKRVLFFWHSLGNYFLTFLSNMFSNLNMTDMENCYKVFRAEIIKKIILKENRFGIEPELVAKFAKIKDIRIYEVGVKYFGRKYAEGKKITWKDAFSALRCIIIYNLFKK
jgi:glycosyltransferase involved in cell wall biosynthesis